jgi:poly-gamma-glutamate synthase PgsB/CapB
MEIIIALVIPIFLIWWILEYRRHKVNVARVPIRIHVNGTRGKSSVTRLIAGALREAGIKTVAKTTGTLPQFIFEDGTEEPIVRLGPPNIQEQVGIIRRAANMGVDAIVLECMALQPDYQELSERKIVRSTIGVITNARPDHLEVMGPTELDVADALSGTIPPGGICFTAERTRFDRLRKNAEELSARIVQSDPAIVTAEEMAGFSYVEHRENVALVLEITKHLEIPRDVALRGMYKAAPDLGALFVYEIDFFGKRPVFYNGFAANDPESTSALWGLLGLEPDKNNPVIVLANNRADRSSRTVQLASMLVNQVKADYIVLVGTNTKLLWEELGRMGMEMAMVVDMGEEEVEDIFEKCMELTPGRSRIIGVGNIGGIGRELVYYFEARALPKLRHDDSADGV